MSQAQTNPSKPLGVQAASAALKPADAKTADTTPAVTPTAETAAEKAERATRVSRKVFIAVGEIHEFDSVLKAEAFLNAADAPQTYAVLRGNRIGTSKKISLR